MKVFVAAVAFCNVQSFRSRKSDCYSPYDGKSLIEVETGTESKRATADLISEVGCTDMSPVRGGGPTVTAICDTMHMEKLMSAYGDKVKVLHKDAGAYYRAKGGFSRAMTRNSDFFSDYRTYDDQLAFWTEAVKNSGGVASLDEVGKSVEGRPIMAVTLTGPGFSSGKSRMVVTCNLHAREWITGMTCTYAVQEFIKKAKADPSWLTDTEVVIMPVVNPDGLIYSFASSRFWRKNRRVNSSWGSCSGVDLNRNFDPDWAGREGVSSNPCSDVFFGTSPFSEPESMAVKNVIDAAPIKLHLDIHSYGEMILTPWSHTWDAHPRKADVAAVGKAMQAAIKSVNGKRYAYGGNELLGAASGVCPDYGTLAGGLGFTYEVRPGSSGGGFAPPASQIWPSATENLAGFMAGVTWMQGGELPTLPPTQAPSCRRRWFC